MSKAVLILCLFAFLLTSVPGALALNIVSGGVLYGATDVDVDGVLYDVAFVEGVANDLFHNSGGWNFPFTDQVSAAHAARALLDQVLIGQFDMLPSATYGITHPVYAAIPTPYETFILPSGEEAIHAASAVNYVSEDQDHLIANHVFPRGFNTLLVNVPDRFVYPQWTPVSAPSPVPEPATIGLLGIGLAGLAGIRRKRRIEK